MVEIERRFIPLLLPENMGLYPKSAILQTYSDYMFDGRYLLCSSFRLELPVRTRSFFEEHEKGIIRIRSEEDAFLSFTVKLGKGLVRSEFEWKEPVTNASKAYFGSDSISKDRYTVSEDSITLFYDIFKGRYDGAVFCEIEFPNEEDAVAFEPPESLVEVTEDGYFTNASMFFEDADRFMRKYRSIKENAQNKK